MPLLGRHKSLPGGNQASSKQQPTALVCESPLFGTRRQLPLSTASQQQQWPESGKQSLAKHQSWAAAGAKSSAGRPGSPGSARAPDASAAETLSSIPKQITRQQIHYAFSIMDTNADGLIDLRDLSQMLANLGVPIDEAILSHVMSSVSKRGEHRISEPEFLDWIGNFIQVSESASASSCSPAASSSANWQERRGAARSSSSPLAGQSGSRAPALVAQSAEARQLIEQQRRQRRGSGSGLALMRSLSSLASGDGAGPAASSSSRDAALDRQQQGEADGEPEASRRSSLAAAAAEQQKEACDDLKAAFCVFDLDGDGFITIDEVQQGLKLLGESWSLAELDQLLFSQREPASQPAAKKAPKSAAGTHKQRISIDDFVKLLL